MQIRILAVLFFLLFQISATKAEVKETVVVEPIEHFSVTNSDLAFGEMELQRMLKDRPMMASFVTHGDEVWLMARRYFAGELTGHRVHWNSAEDYDCPGICAKSWEGNEIFLRTRYKGGEPVYAEKMWACLFFEFFNGSFHQEDIERLRKVRDGGISRDSFKLELLKKQYKAEQYLKEFYTRYWFPQMRKKKLESKYWLWAIDAPTDFEEWKDIRSRSRGFRDFDQNNITKIFRGSSRQKP
ncbi:MAG: hypothetical protein AB7W16_20565 [Candidatus Obscuribacterales bacterium]